MFTAYSHAPNKYIVHIGDKVVSLNEIILLAKSSNGVVETLGTTTEKNLGSIVHVLHMWVAVPKNSEPAKLYFQEHTDG
jgi:hypothetical protein